MLENTKWTIQRNCQHRVSKTQDEEKQKHNTICVEHHYTQTNTNNVKRHDPSYNMIGCTLLAGPALSLLDPTL